MNYVVKQRWLSGKGKKVYQSGDIVTEMDFPENFNLLIKEGRIASLENPNATTEKEAIERVAKEHLNKENKELTIENIEDASRFIISQLENKAPLFIFEPQGENRSIFIDTDLNKAELVEHLLSIGIPFNPMNKKGILWDLLLESLKAE